MFQAIEVSTSVAVHKIFPPGVECYWRNGGSSTEEPPFSGDPARPRQARIWTYEGLPAAKQPCAAR